MRIIEKLFEHVPSDINRAVLERVKVEFKTYLHFEKSIENKKLIMNSLIMEIKKYHILS